MSRTDYILSKPKITKRDKQTRHSSMFVTKLFQQQTYC